MEASTAMTMLQKAVTECIADKAPSKMEVTAATPKVEVLAAAPQVEVTAAAPANKEEKKNPIANIVDMIPYLQNTEMPSVDDFKQKSGLRLHPRNQFFNGLCMAKSKGDDIGPFIAAHVRLLEGHAKGESIQQMPFESKSGPFGAFSNWAPSQFDFMPSEELNAMLANPFKGKISCKYAELAMMITKVRCFPLKDKTQNIDDITTAFLDVDGCIQKYAPFHADGTLVKPQEIIKHMGRQVQVHFDDAVWVKVAWVMMIEIAKAKFKNPEFLPLISSIGNNVPVEVALDANWGVGLKEHVDQEKYSRGVQSWLGFNYLGLAIRQAALDISTESAVATA